MKKYMTCQLLFTASGSPYYSIPGVEGINEEIKGLLIVLFQQFTKGS